MTGGGGISGGKKREDIKQVKSWKQWIKCN